MFGYNCHIHEYSPGVGSDNPLESKVFQQYKSSVILLLLICCKFFPSNYFVIVFPFKHIGDLIVRVNSRSPFI